MTDDIIQDLCHRCDALHPLSFTQGNIRCNYVSRNLSYKTTIFVSDEQDAIRVLERICEVIDDPFDQISLPIPSKDRQAKAGVTKRKQPLYGVLPNVVNYQEPLCLQLCRVALRVNGLKKPLNLFQLKNKKKKSN